MNGTIAIRAACAAGAVALVFGLAGCGDDGAGSAGGAGGLTQTGPGGDSSAAAVAVTVSGAVPVSGNAIVTGSGAASAILVGTTRRVTADGSGNGVQHRFAVDYDAVSGTVLAVTHGWGMNLSSLEGATQCVRAPTAAGQVACGGSVTLDTSRSRVVFSGTVLRGAGNFTSILTGRIDFTSP